MKRADFLTEVLDTILAISDALGRQLEQHGKSLEALPELDMSELKASYMAYGGIIALNDLMEVLHESIKEDDKENTK